MVLRRYELTDFEWSVIAPLLPDKPRGVPRVDDRRVLNGICWRLRTGSPWSEFPERHGPCTRCCNRFVRGGPDRCLGGDLQGDIRGLRGGRTGHRQHLDPRSPARGERKKGGPEATGAAGLADVRARALGRSRGGLTSRLHVITDARGLPIALHLTAGQAHDGHTGATLLATLGPGQRLIADRAYDMDSLRASLAARGVEAAIRPLAHRNPMPPCDRDACRRRNRIERFFSKIRQFRAIATRYEKLDNNFLNLIRLAATRIWLRTYESVA